MTIILVSGVVAWQAFGFDWARPDGDPWNYLAAGERLNEGHPLYALSPGDRPVVIVPPYWTAPLLAPPPIAVFWRPLAAIGPTSMVLWGAAGALAIAGSAWFLGRRGALPLVAILATELWLTALSGNASALMLPALIGAWAYRDRPWITGTLVALAGAIKVLPFALLIWLIATKRWKAVAVTFVVGLLILFVTIAGAGPGSFVDWWHSASSAAPAPSSVAARLHVPAWSVAACLAIPIVVFMRRDRWSFAAAIVATTFATPAFYFSALVTLAALPVWRDRVASYGTAEAGAGSADLSAAS